MISRALRAGVGRLEPVRQPIIERIARQVDDDGRVGDGPLETALSLAALD